MKVASGYTGKRMAQQKSVSIRNCELGGTDLSSEAALLLLLCFGVTPITQHHFPPSLCTLLISKDPFN